MGTRGRPTRYKPGYAAQAAKLTKLGATDRELADFFEVTEATINNWKVQFPDFFESLTRGKEESDGRVEQSLYRRALGYSHDAVKIMMGKDGIERHRYVEHFPPDTTACIFWLKNRQPDQWRDKLDVDTGLTRGRASELLALIEKQLIAAEGASIEAPATARQPGTAH
jgi:hypothetical protein